MEGNQELELTGREFVDSPAIPKLPPLKNLSSANPPTIFKPVIGPQPCRDVQVCASNFLVINH
ncbi:hypothetical protein V7S43_006916 [Phytophthora oleae]|uniref:Uncharacterized protein n=1 Tax=Phytophthora oleae TaxID=2107226 RepID=A0ABD3FQA7_9STRA